MARTIHPQQLPSVSYKLAMVIIGRREYKGTRNLKEEVFYIVKG